MPARYESFRRAVLVANRTSKRFLLCGFRRTHGSIYKFQITKELARVDGVDVTNWLAVRTDSSFLTQEDYDQDAVQTFDA